jgi:hypothetical protein
MTSQTQELYNQTKQELIEYDMDCHFSEEPFTWTGFLTQMFQEDKARAECKKEGHIWESDSRIGPDSGFETLSCIRCGFSNTIHYY